jgi:hypothetical protein
MEEDEYLKYSSEETESVNAEAGGTIEGKGRK